ncbi:MAG: aconitase family protein [Acidimicrobiales bacterium]
MPRSSPPGGVGLSGTSLPTRPGHRPVTLAEKVWRAHRERPDDERAALVIDRVLLHERQLAMLGRQDAAEVRIARPERIVACVDQQVPTAPTHDGMPASAQLVAALERLEATSEQHAVPLFGPGDHRGGVVNVVAPEQGMTWPGSLVVGADDHVSTHGAFGALAFVVRDAEISDVLERGTIDRTMSSTMRLTVAGRLGDRACAKDLALWILGRLGPGAGRGAILELAGPVIRALSMEARMTVCNLAAESGADAVLIAPDAVTEDYLHGRAFAPDDDGWDDAVAGWRGLRSDPGARFDADLVAPCSDLGPQVTWGTSAHQVAPLDGVVPEPDPHDTLHRQLDLEALDAQGLRPGMRLADIAVDHVFIGSCANARIEDLRAAASGLRAGDRASVRSWVVPGSWPVRRQAEAEGLHRVFIDAGFDWREPGCSLCIGVNGDAASPHGRLASTANRPARGRVGPGTRVHLLSPASAVATALSGHLRGPAGRPERS